MDLRVPFELLLAHFGVPATVTRPAPDDDVIETAGIWLTETAETQPFGTDFRRREPRRLIGLARSVVPTLPRGTLIVAAEFVGGVEKTWRVDEFDRAESDQWRAIVVQIAAP